MLNEIVSLKSNVLKLEQNEQAEIQWRSSVDTLSWSDWQHLCLACETPPQIIIAPICDEFIQFRRVEGDKVIWTSAMFYWSK